MADDVFDPISTDWTPNAHYEDSDSASEGGSIYGDNQNEQEVQPSTTPTIVAVNGATKSNSKEGELYKQGGEKNDQGWKKRYFRFDGKTLKYYKNRNTPVSQRSISVASMKNVQAKDDRRRSSTSGLFSARAYQFELECMNRTFLFGTDDHNNALHWQSFLMAAICESKKNGEKFQDGGEMCKPDVCGSIKFDNNRKKYFVAIKGDKFRYYYNEQDYRYDSPKHELSTSLLSVKEVGPTKLKLSSHLNQTFLLNFESADEARQWKMEIEDAIEDSIGDNEALENVKELTANQTCADCSSSRVKWASINFGIILCAKCAGIHRAFGVTISKVRSLKMDSIFKTNKDFLRMFHVIGNKNANAFWYQHAPANDGLVVATCVADRKIHLTRKYLKRTFADLQQGGQDLLNMSFLAAVRVNDVQNAMSCLFSGAQMSCRSDDGKSAVEIAESLGHNELKEFLLQNEKLELPALTKAANGQVGLSSPTRKTAIHHSGELEKTGPKMTGYLKRKFVLQYGNLTYYNDKKEKGTISVVDDIVSVSSSLATDREYAFEIGCKANRRVYRFAAPDGQSRTAWMSALVKVICPTEILPEQIDECSSLLLAGMAYMKSGQGVWRRAWLTLRGPRLDFWNIEDMTHCLTISIIKNTILNKCNMGKSSSKKDLQNNTNDFRLLDGNPHIEIVTPKGMTKFQCILIKDTEKLCTYIDQMLKMLGLLG